MSDPGKYIRLFGTLLLALLGFILSLILLFLGIRLVFGFVNELPWFSYVFSVFVLSVPAAIFITAFSIFFLRTRKHPSGLVRIFSLMSFVVFLLAWIVVYVLDMIAFFKTGQTQIVETKSWNMIFLAASVSCLFIIGVIQALSAPKEKDWLDRHEERSHLN
jgi:hypothetical protein